MDLCTQQMEISHLFLSPRQLFNEMELMKLTCVQKEYQATRIRALSWKLGLLVFSFSLAVSIFVNGRIMADNFSVVLNGHYIYSDIPFTWYIVDIAVNIVFSFTAVIGNTFIIFALWKLSPLWVHSVLEAHLFSFALADFGVGAIVQPLYIAAVLTCY